ncbi:MAG: TonB-dependent receptor [Candidatus Sericytochromatia bacterium]|nr:TonB-dependent receptor [Candidatus Tanganyikabacteria bacterium]
MADTSPARALFRGQQTTQDLTRPRTAFGKLAVGDPDEAGRFTLAGNYQHLESGGKYLDWSLESGKLDSKNQVVLDNYFLRSTFERTVADNLSVRAGAAVAGGGPTAEDRLDVGKEYLAKIRKAGYTGVDLGAEVRYAVTDSSELTLGADFTADDQRIQSIYDLYLQKFGVHEAGAQNPSGPDLGRKTFTNVGLFSQGVFRPLEPIGLTVGVRGDRHSAYGDVLNYRAGAVYDWTDALTSKLLFGTSFKAPSPLQLYSAPIQIGDLEGNPQLRPETAQTVETELLWEASEHLVLSVDAYWTRVKDLTQIQQALTNYRPVNVGEATTTGVEGAARWQVGAVRGYVNGTLQDTRILSAAATGGTAKVTGSELFPAVLANVGALAPAPGLPADLHLEIRYIGDMLPSSSNLSRAPEPYRVPAAVYVDAGLLARKFLVFGRPARVSAKATNLLDNRAPLPGFGGVDIPAPGRGFALTLAQGF